MLSVNNISMRFGPRILFEDVTCTFMAGRRYALYAKPHDDLTDADGMRLGELEGIVGEEGGYTAEADAGILLDGLGIESSLQERVLLAQALFGNPSALLLDEPTNHLDLDSVHWLQDYLREYEGVLIVISHDR